MFRDCGIALPTVAEHKCYEESHFNTIRQITGAAIQDIGPVEVLPEKARIAFHVRMSFAQVPPRRAWLDGRVVLARRLERPRFRSVQTFSPHNHLHAFRLETLEDIDDEFRGGLAEAHAVREQKHLAKGPERG